MFECQQKWEWPSLATTPGSISNRYGCWARPEWPRLQGELRISSATVNTTVSYEPDFVYLVTKNIEDFQRAIEENREPAASGTDGLKLVQLTEGMIYSAKTSRTVKLEPLR